MGTGVSCKKLFLKNLFYKDFQCLDYEVMKEILSEQTFHMECIQTATLCGFGLHFNISPGKTLFSLYNCCYA